jgi:hypothetical protein
LADDDPELAQFVSEHLRSMWAVELLLTLKADPERCWSPADLVRELRGSKTLVDDNLQRLHRAGLVIEDDDRCWRYRPAGAVIASLADRLEQAYRERPVSVINLIARRDPIQGLADAFKFRGEK